MKCALSHRDIADGDLVVSVIKHNAPGEVAPVLLSSLKQAFNNTKIVEELRDENRKLKAQVSDIKSQLGIKE